jgi:hypothetical protein
MRLTFLVFFSTWLLFAKAGFPQSIGESLHTTPKLFSSFTGYTSFIKGDLATFSGIRGGLNFNNTLKFGIGISHLNSSVVTPIYIKENDLNYSTNGSLKFTYGEVSAEYVFYNQPPWQFSIPVSIGFGSAHYNYISRTNYKLTHSSNYSMWILQPEADAQYIILRWIAANSSLGYVTMLYAPDKTKGSINSVTFSVGFRLFLDEIWKSFRQGKSS